jgi:hypothetical protein
MSSSLLARLDEAVKRIGEHVANRPHLGLTHDAADGPFGTIECDDALGFDPLVLLSRLDHRGARATVIGQIAGILHGSQELTGDLDLLWTGDPNQAPHFVAAFADVDASLSDEDGNFLPIDTRSFGLAKVLFRSSGASGDCCTPLLPWGDLDIVGVMDRADLICERGVTIRYASLPDLIDMREAAGRPKDLRRAEELRHLKRD